MLPASTIPTDLHMFAPMVLENTNDAIMLVKYPPNATRGSIVYVNAAFTAQTGYTLDDVAGQAPRMLVSPDADPEALAELMSAVRSGQPIRTEVPNRTKDGRLVWEAASISAVRNLDGEIAHFMAIEEDITERRL